MPVFLQAGFGRLYLACDGWSGHAVCATGQRGKGLFNGVPGSVHFGCDFHGVSWFFCGKSHENVSH
ncbi:hypothetical protein D3C85_1760780 [compost metagenome]